MWSVPSPPFSVRSTYNEAMLFGRLTANKQSNFQFLQEGLFLPHFTVPTCSIGLEIMESVKRFDQSRHMTKD